MLIGVQSGLTGSLEAMKIPFVVLDITASIRAGLFSGRRLHVPLAVIAKAGRPMAIGFNCPTFSMYSSIRDSIVRRFIFLSSDLSCPACLPIAILESSNRPLRIFLREPSTLHLGLKYPGMLQRKAWSRLTFSLIISPARLLRVSLPFTDTVLQVLTVTVVLGGALMFIICPAGFRSGG